METCEVLIVGGGPAGSSCARRLVQAGRDVLVLDKRSFPRDKTCAGWITPAVVESLELDLDDYRRDRVLQAITGFAVGLVGGPEVETDHGRPISYGIRRCEFDDYLLRRSGARLRLNESVTSLEREGSEWIVNRSLRARMLVGAGGHFCPVARFLGTKGSGWERAVAAQEIEVELTEEQLRSCPVKPGIPYLYFCPDLQGYGWYYRKGNYLNVGLGREDNHRLADHVSAFVAWLRQQGKIPDGLPTRYSGHAYLVYPHSQRPLLGEGVLLIGDAAGMAYVPSGEGIRPAVETGLLAGEVITAANGDYRASRLEPYQTRVRQRFGKRSASASVPGWLEQRIAGRLLAWRWFARHFVVDRWFSVRLHEPASEL